MDVLIDLEYAPVQEDGSAVDAAAVDELARFAMAHINLPQTAEVSVTFVDNDRMAQLNEQYRGKVGPTDVLSFECDNLDDGFPSAEGAIFALGDIVVAPDVAYAQSLEYGNAYEDELALLLVHGILHLAGYDHIEDDEALVMEAKQREVLDAFRAAKR